MRCDKCEYQDDEFDVAPDGFYVRKHTAYQSQRFMVMSKVAMIDHLGVVRAQEAHKRVVCLRCPKCGGFNIVSKH